MGRIHDIMTVFWRDWIVLKHRMTAFIISRMIAPMLYMVAFGWGLGRSIDTGVGVSYLDFLVPGILALNSMNISFNSVTPVHAERVYHKSLEEYIVAPIWPSAYVIGKVMAAVLRGLISSIIILALAFAFGAQVVTSIWFWLVIIMNCGIFAGIGFLASMYLSTYEKMGQINTYVLLPMSFLCGTFFSTKTMPDMWRLIIDVLPLTHTSITLRAISLGQPFEYLSVVILLAYLVVVTIWGCRAFEDLRK